MTQEDKELFLQDLCARLPYKLICEVKFREYGTYKTSNMFLDGVFKDEAYFTSKEGSIYSNDYKPYLFPLSSMTEEQKRAYNMMSLDADWVSNPHYNVPAYNVLDWLNENHLDYRDLIGKGLAIDATGKKIY